MAGGFGGKFDPKNKSFKNTSFSSEVLKDSASNNSGQKQEKSSIFNLRGILGLGQTVDLGKQEQKTSNWGKEFFSNINHLQQQEKYLLDEKQKELEKTIKQLQEEIQKLTKASENLEKDVENVSLQPVVEFNEYQLNFLDRIRKFVINLRKNISEASMWVESFNAKKKKKN